MSDESRSAETNNHAGESESVVQAGKISGGVHFHRNLILSDRSRPHQLPRDPTAFVNREAALVGLDEFMLTQRGIAGGTAPLVVISGSPGVGKTALALRWCHSIRDEYPDGEIYVDLGGYGGSISLSTEQIMGRVVRSFGVASDGIPTTIEDLAGLYRSLLSSHDCILLLDNAPSVNQVRRLLPANANCLAVVTSRATMGGLVAREGAHPVDLDVLSPDDSFEFFLQSMGEERVLPEPEAARRLAELCGFLPLALRVVAERAVVDSHTSLGELVAEVESEGNRLDALAATEDLADVRGVFSWSYRALSSGQQSAFRLLGLHPGPELDVRAMGALLGSTEADARRELAGLAQVHLLEQLSRDRFRMHDLLKAFAQECCQRDLNQYSRTRAVRRLISWYLVTLDAARLRVLPYSQSVPLGRPDTSLIATFSDATAAMDWFELERFNILGALRLSVDWGQLDLGWKLPVLADGFFELLSYWNEWASSHELGLAAAMEMAHDPGEAANLFGLADAHWRAGETDKARAEYEKCLPLASAIGDPWLEGFCLRGLGLLAAEIDGRNDVSLEYIRQALRVFQNSDVIRGQAMCLLSIGRIELEQDISATESLERAMDLFRSINDTWSEGWGGEALGQALLKQGNLAEAQTVLNRSVDIFTEFRDSRSAAASAVLLGDVYKKIGLEEQAISVWEAARDTFERLNDARLSGVVMRIENSPTEDDGAPVNR